MQRIAGRTGHRPDARQAAWSRCTAAASRRDSDGPGQGSEFVVRLPLVAGESPTDRKPSGEAPASAVTHRAHPGRRRQPRTPPTAWAMLLEHHGPRGARRPRRTRRRSRRSKIRPQVVLLDIGMPGMNGYEVCRRIREHALGTADRRSIALTGWGQDEDRRRTREAGFDHHLVKPVESSMLVNVLAQVTCQT